MHCRERERENLTHDLILNTVTVTITTLLLTTKLSVSVQVPLFINPLSLARFLLKDVRAFIGLW